MALWQGALADFSIKKISLYYTLGKWRFDKPLLRIFFRKFFSPHYTLKKAGFDTPLLHSKIAENFAPYYTPAKQGFCTPLQRIFFKKFLSLTIR